MPSQTILPHGGRRKLTSARFSVTHTHTHARALPHAPYTHMRNHTQTQSHLYHHTQSHTHRYTQCKKKILEGHCLYSGNLFILSGESVPFILTRNAAKAGALLSFPFVLPVGAAFYSAFSVILGCLLSLSHSMQP